MKGTLQLTIGSISGKSMHLEYDFLVEAIDSGLRLTDRVSPGEALLYDVELAAVAKVGGGPTPLTSILISHLLDEKFGYEN